MDMQSHTTDENEGYNTSMDPDDIEQSIHDAVLAYYHYKNTCYIPSRHTPGIHSPHCPSKATLLGMPNETRNTICALVLEMDKSERSVAEERRKDHMFAYPEGSINIRYTPPILQVCSQMRSEFHQMYLASNDFFAIVKERDGASHNPHLDLGYRYLLDILAHLGTGHVRAMKSISIACKDSCIISECINDGLIDMWDSFIPELLARGIQIDQLRWPGVCLPRYVLDATQDPWISQAHDHPDEWTDFWEDELKEVPAHKMSATLTDSIIQTMDLYRYIVKPTLWSYSCTSLRYPIPDVGEQGKKAQCIRLPLRGRYDDRRLAESFGQIRYERELDPERKQHWRRQSMYWVAARDADEEYRAVYPTRRDKMHRHR